MKKIIPILCVLTLVLAGTSSGQKQSVCLNTAFSGPVYVFFKAITKEIFEKEGFDVTIQHPPAERALQMANSGVDDGDGPRIGGLGSKYPNLLQIPEKIIDVDFTAFSKQNIYISGWESLKPYRVGFLIGWKILEDNIVEAKSIHKVAEAETLFRLLASGRIDVAVINRVDGLAIIRTLKLEGISPLNPPLAQREMFLYLHKKHEHLVPRITADLRAMKADGRYGRILDTISEE